MSIQRQNADHVVLILDRVVTSVRSFLLIFLDLFHILNYISSRFEHPASIIMFVLLPALFIVYYLCFYVLFYAGIQSRILFWSLFLLALFSPPLALFVYCLFRFPGYRKLRRTINEEAVWLNLAGDESERYQRDNAPYVSTLYIGTTFFFPMTNSWMMSYLSTASIGAISSFCAGMTVIMLDTIL